jgi:CRP/FNR family transcriptional regulator
MSLFSDIAQPLEESAQSGEDALYYLPHSTASSHQKGEIIYAAEEPSASLYLVNRGRVKVSRIFHTGREVVMDIYQKDEFFGESALAGP